MFQFLKKKKPRPAAGKRLGDKPDPDLLRDKMLVCSGCQTIFSFADMEPLLLGRCEKCQANNFIPYLVKDYWLYKPLGGGGMGSVYKALNLNDREDYAVKILARDSKDDEYLIRALLREGEIASKFSGHDHITEVVEYGLHEAEEDFEYFLAMQFVSGRRLDQLIESYGHASPKYVLLWGMQIISAEQHIYSCNYLYRDLKPQNIMIDDYNNAKLFDFGLCQTLEEAACDPGDTVEGSPIYLPPERLEGTGEDMHSEIYSLGMVLYHALSGKPFYTATTAIELAKRHMRKLQLASVSSRLPSHIHPEITRILDKMIRRAPEERYQTFNDALIDISEAYKII